MEREKQAILVYVTTPNRSDALRIGKEIVSRRLAACANIVPEMSSIYWWDGDLQEESESLLLLKSRAELADKIREAVVELHPYGVPAISVIDLKDVHPPYLRWMWEETRKS